MIRVKRASIWIRPIVKNISSLRNLFYRGGAFYTLEAECESRGSARIEVVYSDGQVDSNVSDAVNLSDFSDLSCDFRVGYGSRTMQVRGRMGGDAEEGDYILLRNIRIVSSPITVRNRLFHIAVFLLFWIYCFWEYAAKNISGSVKK